MPRLHPSNLFLTGFMGVGKSTVGEALAARLGWRFADSDAQIVKRAGMSVADFFKHSGEAAFRVLEGQVIEELTSGKSYVISLGGGALLNDASRDLIFRAGLLIYLKAKPETLVTRLSGESRPLLRGLKGPALLEHVKIMLGERDDVYSLAAMQVDTDGLDVTAVADEIARRLGV